MHFPHSGTPMSSRDTGPPSSADAEVTSQRFPSFTGLPTARSVPGADSLQDTGRATWGCAAETPLLQALLGRAGISAFRLLGSLRPQPLGEEPLQALSRSPPPLQPLPRVTAQPPSVSQLFPSPSSALQPLPCFPSRKRAFTSSLRSAGFSVLLTIMFLFCF